MIILRRQPEPKYRNDQNVIEGVKAEYRFEKIKVQVLTFEKTGKSPPERKGRLSLLRIKGL